MDALGLLRRYYGHDSFRPGQAELVDAILRGRDVLGVMPTGAGKSVCYQIPALMLPGVTLVVSPLISLMKDQVAGLRQLGIDAAYINSSLPWPEYREVLRRARAGAYKLLYVAPERLENPEFLEVLGEVPVPLVAVDEAHCISRWGRDFRPGYMQIADFVGGRPRRPVVGAFTATATEEIREDIVDLLRLRDPVCVTTGFDRPNLYFDVLRPPDKLRWLVDYIRRRPDACGIVYCATRRTVESVCEELCSRGLSAARYHAGLPDEERRKNQEDFVCDRVNVMVATNAFGMGIDKSGVGYVIHYQIPLNLESYYQEAGRAGRDGGPAECILLYAPRDVETAKFIINNAAANELLTDEEAERMRRNNLALLRRMQTYCLSRRCLRGGLLEYFGENAPARCGNCGNCREQGEERDITIIAQKILSGVARVQRQYPHGLGMTNIVHMLHGSREKRVLELGLDRLSTYGLLRGVKRTEIREYIGYLTNGEYLRLTEGDYPVLLLGPRARAVLFGGEKVLYAGREPVPAAPEPLPGPPPAAAGLYETLRALRASLADRGHVPAYVIFTNAVLSEMARRRPRTPEELRRIPGIGEVKAARYGETFLSAIRDWQRQNPEEPGEGV